jgi:hypothetical protein
MNLKGFLMKKIGLGMGLVLASILTAGASAAQASEIQLGRIDTNNCAAAESEVNLLNSSDIRVDTYCEAGNFAGKNGRVYRYRLHTTADVPFRVYQNDRIQLGNIDTNNCEAARSEIALLKSPAVAVSAVCEAGYFAGRNGRVYNYRLHTTLTIRNMSAVRY